MEFDFSDILRDQLGADLFDALERIYQEDPLFVSSEEYIGKIPVGEDDWDVVNLLLQRHYKRQLKPKAFQAIREVCHSDWPMLHGDAAIDKELAIRRSADRINHDCEGATGKEASVIAHSFFETLANSLSNFQQLKDYRLAGMNTKMWLSQRDDEVRHSHLEADGQAPALDSPFEVGGERLMYPGDPNGSFSTIHLCRCTMLPRMGE
jgi:hypothetical protein